MRCSRDDVVLLPIPFTDLSSTKVRPAVVVGHGTWPGDLFVVPVTSQTAKADLILTEWANAGLNVPSGLKGQICTVELDLSALLPMNCPIITRSSIRGAPCGAGGPWSPRAG